MILIIDDDIAVRTSVNLLLKQAGYTSVSAPGPEEAVQLIEKQAFRLVILDMNFSVETSGEEGLRLLKQIKELKPQLPVILITGWGSIALAVEGMKNGAADFINKPWENDHLLQVIQTTLRLADHTQTGTGNTAAISRKKLNEQYQLDAIIGEDPQFLSVLQTVGRISATEAPVLIEGESGTGKELIAEAIHQNSLRKKGPFIKVNLGGISSSLFESEMFGHKRGAFTDAKSDRTGRFEMAHKGTIFLDEIGELDINSQVKLLRVLQERRFEVLGDSRTRSADFRVICATNRKLDVMAAAGTFREDLLYRINLITIKLPSLRERPEDIPLLVHFYINNLKTIYHRPHLTVSKQAIQWLKELTFPGNIRQLKNLIERTVLMTQKDVLEVEDFSLQWQAGTKKTVPGAFPAVGMMTLEEMEVAMIKKAMEFHQGNISKVATTLGISRGALYRRLDKFGIPYEAPQ